MRATRARLAAAVVAAVTACAIVVVPGTAVANSGMTTVASELDNPRGLTFGPDGSLYVAEAGPGGSGPCFTGPEGGTVCFGISGASARSATARRGGSSKGLPSIGDQGTGANAIGPSDVSFRGRDLYFTVGLGADPALRASLPRPGSRPTAGCCASRGTASARSPTSRASRPGQPGRRAAAGQQPAVGAGDPGTASSWPTRAATRSCACRTWGGSRSSRRSPTSSWTRRRSSACRRGRRSRCRPCRPRSCAVRTGRTTSARSPGSRSRWARRGCSAWCRARRRRCTRRLHQHHRPGLRAGPQAVRARDRAQRPALRRPDRRADQGGATEAGPDRRQRRAQHPGRARDPRPVGVRVQLRHVRGHRLVVRIPLR